jgi:integrase
MIDDDGDAVTTRAPWPPHVRVLGCWRLASPAEGPFALIAARQAADDRLVAALRAPPFVPRPPPRPKTPVPTPVALRQTSAFARPSPPPSCPGEQFSQDNIFATNESTNPLAENRAGSTRALPNQFPLPREAREEDDAEAEDLEELEYELSAERLAPEVEAAFRRGPGTLPAVAALRGEDLARIARAPKAIVPTMAAKGLVKTTRLEHERMLRRLAAMPADLQPLPLGKALVELFTRERRQRRWRWTTTLKYLASCQGACALLPLYREGAPPMRLSPDPVWSQAMRAAGIAARQELPRQPTPAHWTNVVQAIQQESSLACQTAILLSWFTAARCGCVLQLHSQDVELTPQGLVVRFRRGKSARVRGPYTVHTPPLPEPIADIVRRWLEERAGRTLFPSTTGVDIKIALRRSHPELEQRSLRRGALQTLACAPGITDELLMEFSGHTRVATLRRYLNWGKAAPHLQQEMRRAAGGLENILATMPPGRAAAG